MKVTLQWDKPGPLEYLNVIDSILDSIRFHSDEKSQEEIKKIMDILRTKWRRWYMSRKKFKFFALNVYCLKVTHSTEDALSVYLNLYETVHLGLKGSITHCRTIAKEILEI